MIKFNDEQIKSMRDGYPPSEYDFEETMTSLSYEVAELRECIKIAEDALKRIDNMCDGDMCKFFGTTHHCSACKYLDKCQTGVAHAALHEIREKGANNGK